MTTESFQEHPTARSKFDHFKRFRFGSDDFRQYFRGDFVSRDAGVEFLGLQNGYLYAAICLSPVAAIAIALALNVDFAALGRMAWLAVPYFLVLNLFEYLLHRYPMHHRYSPANVVYAHVSIHHNFYDDEHFYFEQHRDLMASLLPWYAFLGISAFVLIVGGVIYAVGGLNHALFFALVGYSYYLMYEIFHAAYHTPPDSWVKKIPFVTTLARAHLQHHRYPYMAAWNFNITFPIFDRVFGTLLPADGHPPK